MCDAGRMNAVIKEYQPSDEDLVVEFALRSWAPVFASLKEVLGAELFTASTQRRRWLARVPGGFRPRDPH